MTLLTSNIALENEALSANDLTLVYRYFQGTSRKSISISKQEPGDTDIILNHGIK